MRMLRWVFGATKLDKIRNERIKMTTKVGEITKKVQERRLKWYGHVMRREEHYVGRRAMVMKVQGRRKRGRPKRRWLDKVKDDIKEKGLSADDVYDRATWRPQIKVGKDEVEEAERHTDTIKTLYSNHNYCQKQFFNRNTSKTHKLQKSKTVKQLYNLKCKWTKSRELAHNSQ